MTATKRICNLIDELPPYKERLKDVIIENRDFKNLIKTYDRSSAVFYIDPPYVQTESYYNKKYVNFNKDDHLRLNSVLKGIKGRFICEMYKDYNIKYVSRNNLLPIKPKSRSEFKEVIMIKIHLSDLLGRYRINLEHLDRICEVLECDVADILEYQPNKIKKTGENLILEQNGNRKKNN
ncbi:MAG: DNA adenine methylase [Ruminococcus bromii]|nr:DNA adenine methylase [Ruminococcus bromii]